MIDAATEKLSAMRASLRSFHRRRDAIAIARSVSASELRPSTRYGPLLVPVSLATRQPVSLGSRASDSQASMASSTLRARLAKLAWGSLVLVGASAEIGALGGALGVGPLASPPNETRLCLERGGLVISGEG